MKNAIEPLWAAAELLHKAAGHKISGAGSAVLCTVDCCHQMVEAIVGVAEQIEDLGEQVGEGWVEVR